MTFRLSKGEKVDRSDPAAPPGRAAVQAQRQRLPARHLPRARRYRRPVPGPLRGQGLAHRNVRRRDRIDRRVRSADRREDGDAVGHRGLRQQPLRDAAADHAARDPADQDRPQAAPRRVQPGRPAARGAAAGAAHHLRHRDDGDDGACAGIENYSRYLTGRKPGEPPPTLFEYFPENVAADRRRKPRHRAADRRHVPRRLHRKSDPRRVRLPPAFGDRQPAAQVRGVGGAAAADDLRLRHARTVGNGAHRGHLHRAGHPADRADRSDGDHPPGREAGRRPDRRVPRLRARRPSACWSRR